MSTPWLLPNLASDSAVEEPTAKRLRSAVRVQAVLFDFDGTLTTREEIPGWRLFPDRGGFDRQSPDTAWLEERGFGGHERVSHLREMLSQLKVLGVQSHIVSYADQDVIRRSLSILEMEDFFGDIAGLQDLGKFADKASFLQNFMERKGFTRTEVLFVDDQDKHITHAAQHCLTFKSKGLGLTTAEMDSILQHVCKAHAGSEVRNAAECEKCRFTNSRSWF